MKIHPTAIVSPDANIGEGATIGAYSIIGRQVRIGSNTAISSHVVIEDGTEIGENCQISQFSSIGGVPQDLKFKGEITKVVIGNFNNIREFVSINRATCEDIGVTMIGDHNLIMAYCHVAHNCHLRNNIVLANGTNLAGHVIVEDYAVVGGLTGVHQFTHIGAHSMIGGFSAETLQALKDSYRIIFRSSLLLSQAIDQVRRDVPDFVEVRHFLDFIQKSKRGVCR
jgi:UDP-N-acetylglucosamine acyltransferase